MRSAVVRTLSIIVSVRCLLAADTSSVNIDWSARTTGQQACIAPSTTGSTSATLVLNNANVILYTYTLDVQSYQLPSSDAQNLPAAATGGAAGTPPPADQVCGNYEGNLGQVWNNERLFPKSRQSISLGDTRSALNSESDAIDDIISHRASCKAGLKEKELSQVVDMVVSSLQGYRDKDKAIASSSSLSTISFPYQIDNTHYYVFALRERTRYNGELTTATLTWKCGLDDILTLSLGVMGTTLPYRTYTSQSVPNGTSTQNILTVSGKSGWTPQGLALLNYKLHVFDWGPQPGLAISTGPVFKFGGTPGVSSFGWFAGISLSFWRRLFITPGMHLGQFADFPAGFTAGSVIPANFGQLNPIARWSGRFALGITFQTNSLAKSNSSTPTSPAAPAANPTNGGGKK